MKNLVRFAFDKPLTFKMELMYFRIGKAKGFLEDFNDSLTEDENIKWELEEVQSLAEIYVPKYKNSENLDAFVFNFDVYEEEAESLRKSFWQDIIWKSFPNKPIVLIFPDTAESGNMSLTEILETLSLIRLTDRPWKVFLNDGNLTSDLKQWLKEVCYTPMKINTKNKYYKRLEKEAKEEEKRLKKSTAE